MLKNTNFAFFIFCFMHVLTKPRQYSFTLTSVDLGLSNHMHFFLLHDTMWFDSKKLWLYNIVIQKYLIFYFFFRYMKVSFIWFYRCHLAEATSLSQVTLLKSNSVAASHHESYVEVVNQGLSGLLANALYLLKISLLLENKCKC